LLGEGCGSRSSQVLFPLYPDVQFQQTRLIGQLFSIDIVNLIISNHLRVYKGSFVLFAAGSEVNQM